MQHVKCTLGTKLNCITVVGLFMILKHLNNTLLWKWSTMPINIWWSAVRIGTKPIPDWICWLLACKGEMTELCSFHFDPHFWGIFFRYALVSFVIPFPVVRFNGNYLKTEMMKLFRIFKGKMLEVEKIARQHFQIHLKFRIGNCENTVIVESIWQNTPNI